jgi:WD40 repeat protein
VKIWDLEAGHTLITLTYPDKRIYSVAWSSDGRLASALGDGTVILWNLETGKPAQTLKEHSDRAYSVAWSPDGRLASGSDDHSLIIWDLETGEPAVRLMGNSSVESVAWAADGRLSYGSADWTVNVLNNRFTQSPCEWVGRNLSLAEWKENIGLMHDYRPACPKLPVQSIVPFSKDYFEFTLQGRILVLLALLSVLALVVVITRMVIRKPKERVVQLAEQRVLP